MLLPPSDSSCFFVQADLSVVTEVRGASGNKDLEETDISIKKTTVIAADKPSFSKTTEVSWYAYLKHLKSQQI